MLFVASINATDLYLVVDEDDQRMACISCNEYVVNSIQTDFTAKHIGVR